MELLKIQRVTSMLERYLGVHMEVAWIRLDWPGALES